MNNFRKEYELGDFEPIKLDTAIVELMIRGRKQALEEVEKLIDEQMRTFRVINGKAPECCKRAFIEGEKVGNEKLEELKSKIKEMK